MTRKYGWLTFHVVRPKDTQSFKLGSKDYKPQPTLRKLMKELRRVFPKQEFSLEAKGRKSDWAPRTSFYRRKQ
jgi:hypothetical protein